MTTIDWLSEFPVVSPNVFGYVEDLSWLEEFPLGVYLIFIVDICDCNYYAERHYTCDYHGEPGDYCAHCELYHGRGNTFKAECERCQHAVDDGEYSTCTEHADQCTAYVENPEDWGVCTSCGRIDDCYCDIFSECSCGGGLRCNDMCGYRGQ